MVRIVFAEEPLLALLRLRADAAIACGRGD
jgi:hypothetical protein